MENNISFINKSSKIRNFLISHDMIKENHIIVCNQCGGSGLKNIFNLCTKCDAIGLLNWEHIVQDNININVCNYCDGSGIDNKNHKCSKCHGYGIYD